MSGWKKWVLLRLLGQYADALEAQGKNERAVNGVLDLMDSVDGWCHPNFRLDD